MSTSHRKIEDLDKYQGVSKDLEEQNLFIGDSDDMDTFEDVPDIDIKPEDAEHLLTARRSIEDHLDELQFHKDLDYLDDEDFDDLDDLAD